MGHKRSIDMKMKINPWQYVSKVGEVLNLDYWGYRMIDLPILIKWANLPRKSRVLHIGCGNGKTTVYLDQQLHCKSVSGIDIDHNKIALAERNAKNNTHIIFQAADAAKLPFEDESFDAVLNLDVLHHVTHWQKAVKEIHRVLKPKGKLLMRDYSIETFALPGVGLLYRQLFDHPYDHMYDQIEFLTYLRKHGFDITHQNDSAWMILLVAQKKKIKK